MKYSVPSRVFLELKKLLSRSIMTRLSICSVDASESRRTICVCHDKRGCNPCARWYGSSVSATSRRMDTTRLVIRICHFRHNVFVWYSSTCSRMHSCAGKICRWWPSIGEWSYSRTYAGSIQTLTKDTRVVACGNQATVPPVSQLVESSAVRRGNKWIFKPQSQNSETSRGYGRSLASNEVENNDNFVEETPVFLFWSRQWYATIFVCIYFIFKFSK